MMAASGTTIRAMKSASRSSSASPHRGGGCRKYQMSAMMQITMITASSNVDIAARAHFIAIHHTLTEAPSSGGDLKVTYM